MGITRYGLGTIAVVVTGLLGAYHAGSWVNAQGAIEPKAPPAFKAEDPAFRALDANLYMQTSAEYRACCLQAFNLARFRLKDAVIKKPNGKLAVVLDLDETVFDNSGFQAMQIRSGLAYDQRIWDMWEKDKDSQVGLIPGAQDFLDEAAKLKVTIAYISNRKASTLEQTKEIIKRLGIPLPPDELIKLSTETSDKTKRRAEVEKAFDVVLYIGDNLRDFNEVFICPPITERTPENLKKAIADRKKNVDNFTSHWGEKWIILPNPAYGEWTKPLGQGSKDLDLLAPPIPPKK